MAPMANSGIQGVYGLSEGRKEENHSVYSLALEQDYDRPGSHKEDRMGHSPQNVRA